MLKQQIGEFGCSRWPTARCWSCCDGLFSAAGFGFLALHGLVDVEGVASVRQQAERHVLPPECLPVPSALAPSGIGVAVVATPAFKARVEQGEKGTPCGVRACHFSPILSYECRIERGSALSFYGRRPRRHSRCSVSCSAPESAGLGSEYRPHHPNAHPEAGGGDIAE